MTTTPPLPSVPVRSAGELTDRWSALLAPPVSGARSLWLMWLQADGCALPAIVPVDDLPRVPDAALLGGLVGVLRDIAEDLDGAGHVAMALCRPGHAVITAEDDDWAGALHEVLDDGALDQTWSLHLAAGGRVLPLVEPLVGPWRAARR